MGVLTAICHFCAGCLLTVVGNWLGLIPWRRSRDAHWTERARLLWPARVTAVTSVFLNPTVLGQLHRACWPESAVGWAINGLAACLGVLLGSFPFDREIFPGLVFAAWLRETVAGWTLRLGVWIALIAGMILMPAEWGWKTILVSGGFLLLQSFLSFGLTTAFLRWMGMVKAPDERLCRITAAASERAGRSPRSVWMMTGVAAQAYAFPFTGELIFSERLLRVCTDEEVATICAHELAHLGEPGRVLAGRFVGSLMFFPLLFLNPCFHSWGMGFLLLPLFSLLLARFSKWLSLRMERRADQAGTGSQVDEGVYARALEKLYRENQVPAVNINNSQTHPHLYDRMLAAGITPEYPRPARPAKTTWFRLCQLVAFATFLIREIARS